MTFIIPEILAKVRECKTELEVEQVLWKHRSPAMGMMFQYVFHPKAIFTFQELPEFKPDPGPIGMNPNNLFNEMRRLYIFMDSKQIPLKKKKQLLIVLLESLHPSESALVGQIFKKDLEIPLITKEVAQMIYPKFPMG